jgi:glycosyltransferase involved in cell wall biosynthesis
MRVLMVSRWMWEERKRSGGKPGFFGELAQAISAQGVKLTILSQAVGAASTPESRPVEGLDLWVFCRDGRDTKLSLVDKLLKRWGGYRKAATDAAAIRRFVREQGPFDAVVAQCEEPDGLACALAAWRAEFPPLVTAVHDLRYRFQGERIEFVHKSSLGFVCRQSARVVANSLTTARWLEREYSVPAGKIGQARIHLTTPFLRAAAEKSGTRPSGEERVLFLGALNRKKAPDVFLRAAAQVAPELPGATFVVVGAETSEDAPFRAELGELRENRALAGRVKFLGRLDAAGVIDEIARARVVVCPSRIETFSRTTIEALALGRPVIVTETTGAAEWVRSTGGGAVVAPGDADALASAIRHWVTAPTPADVSARVVKELTVARAAEDWVREVRAAVGQPVIS